ncbi:nucleobindin-2 isoform X2 [Cylas formicarius]|uniref:nucleobindin-2 isoform X2 n=1 Tax=Cylas formicarius TaxID=197179 RepID=UPI002958538C|nr:nucleobindin-2 isoform X2 [Cylas formicarius]
MERYLVLVLLLLLSLQICVAPPVIQDKQGNDTEATEHQDDSNIGGLEDIMEYHRYLKEVVNALESDPEFRKKLEKADETEIKSGKIAEELQFVSHHVRNRLDEIKRVELQRLKELMAKKMQFEQGDSNDIHEDPTHHHLDHSNPHTFEIEDLKKLIAKTTQDLAEADKKRREDFKQYEMEKEYQKIEKLNHTNGEEKEKLEKQYKEMEEKHKKHEKLHEPGHKAQLEEVWQEQDQMQQEFNPKTFFLLHDVDGNGLWDQEEVKALFIKELDKMYQEGAPEDDMRERVEEMERMRETVFQEMDANRDGFIDFNEFMRQTNSNDFKQDHGWQSLDEQTRPYTDEELNEYIRVHHQRNQIPQHGYQVPHPAAFDSQAGQGVYQQVPPVYQQGGQFHPGQMPQMPPQQLPNHPQYQQYQMAQNHPPKQIQQQYQQIPQSQTLQQVSQQHHQASQGQQVPQQVSQNQLPPQQYQALDNQQYQVPPNQQHQAPHQANQQQNAQGLPLQHHVPIANQQPQQVPQNIPAQIKQF